jgi:hypothetical protein
MPFSPLPKQARRLPGKGAVSRINVNQAEFAEHDAIECADGDAIAPTPVEIKVRARVGTTQYPPRFLLFALLPSTGPHWHRVAYQLSSPRGRPWLSRWQKLNFIRVRNRALQRVAA